MNNVSEEIQGQGEKKKRKKYPRQDKGVDW